MTVRVLCRSAQRDQVVGVAKQRGQAVQSLGVEWLIADNKEDELRHAPNADAIWTSRDTQVIDAAPNCRWVQVGSAGVDSVDMTQLNERGIELTNAAVIYGPALADHNMALILAWSRQLPFLFEAQQRGVWESRSNFPGGELAEQTILVVGLGGAGTMTAARAKGFGMHVVGTRRRVDEPLPPCVDEQVSLTPPPSRQLWSWKCSLARF
jgi:phosphoglycerate dehydrogenase-like enzyme